MTEEPSSDASLGAIHSYPRTNTQFVMASKASRAISGSENCNPNVIPGSCKRKIVKPCTAEQFLESNSAPKNLRDQACTEFNLISPPRKHVCSSRRCASKNPGYAVPATVNPKKFLASKRQVLPPKDAALCKCCLRKSKGEDGAPEDQNGNMEFCNRCSHKSQKRRWSSDDSVSRQLTGVQEPVAFSLTSSERHEKNALHNPDAGQSEHCEQASKNEAVHLPASETVYQECSTDTPKSWNCPNELPNLQTPRVQDHHFKTVSDVNHLEDSSSPAASTSSSGGYCGSESKHRAAYFNNSELQASPLLAGEGLFRFGENCLNSASDQTTSAAGDNENPSLMPENEEAAISPSPEKSGNWRLNAVLEAFGNLSPTREGRVKTLVRAFESLLSVTERKGEQQAPKPRCPLKFSYLSSNANLEREEDAQREDFTDAWEGENEKEEATGDEEERVRLWQTNLSGGDVKDEEIDDGWQSPHTVRVYSQSVVEGKEKDGMGDQWLPKQECVESREEVVSDEREDGMEKVLPKLEVQEDYAHSAVDTEVKGATGEQWQLPVELSDEKHWQSHQAEQEYAHSLQDGLSDEEVGEMKELSQKQEDQGILAQPVVEEDGEEEDKKKKSDEEQAEGVYTLTLEKGDETNKKEQHPSDIGSTQSLKEVLIEGKAEKDSASQELETRHVPDLSDNPMEAAFKRQPSNQTILTNLQQRSSQKFIDGYFASIAARKKQSSRNRESLRGSKCSISSSRPPLTQKSQVQSAQDKPRLSKPQPFKLLTEARGHMKEQEFVMRLRKILEEEEKLRVPLAQGLPWTTDEPEILYKPPVKENTKPLDVQLNSDLRAMERAEFDRFIAEKLLYIEERRLEEERTRRAAEEEEVKKMRQDMVPKAQLMPYFDRPFRPRRSSKRPTIPKEPQFQLNKQQPKRQKCVANST